MSVDKLVDSTQLDTDLTSIANAIRTKGGTSAQLAFPAGFVSAIQAIPSGGGGLTLIGSGTYTKTGTALSLTIPITMTSGYSFRLVKVIVDNPPANTAQGYSVAKYTNPTLLTDAGLNTYGLAQARGLKADGTYANNIGYQANNIVISDSTLTVNRINGTYPWQQTTYKWYIYGEASS